MNPSLHILIAEDEELNRLLLCEILDKYGHTYRAVGDGREAVALFQENRFDGVLLDLMMPLMGGYEAAACIRSLDVRNHTRTPIAVISGSRDLRSEKVDDISLFDFILMKPFYPDDLKSLLQAMACSRSIDGSDCISQSGTGIPTVLLMPGFLDCQAVFEKTGSDPTFLEKLLRQFEDTSDDILAKIRDGISKGDREIVATCAHVIKGSVSIFDSEVLYDIAERLEHIGDSESSIEIEGLTGVLEEEIRLLIQRFGAFIDNMEAVH